MQRYNYQMEKQFSCGKCNKKYTTNNPPRLLIMCGHTFCQACIKIMLIKKKDNKYKIVCPIEKAQKQLNTNVISNHFPKNISLLQAIQHAQKNNHQNTISDFMSSQLLQALNITNISRIDERKQKDCTSKQTKIELNCQNICLLHQKALDIVCIDEGCRICANCAIFGTHQGHKFIDVQQIQTKSLQYFEKILNIIEIKNKTEKQLSSPSLIKQLTANFNQKKKRIKKQLSDSYESLIKLLRQNQRQNQDRLEDKLSQIEQRLKNIPVLTQQTQIKYNEWSVMANIQMKVLESQNIEDKIALCYGSNRIMLGSIEKGQNIIKEMMDDLNSVGDKAAELLDSVRISINEHLISLIDECIRIVPDYQDNMFQKMKSQIKYITEQSLLEIEQEECVPISMSKVMSSTIKKEPIYKQMTSSYRKLPVNSTRQKQTIVKSQRILPQKQFKKKSYSQIVVPPTFQKTFDALNQETAEVIDFSNGELGDKLLQQICERITPKVTTLKLIKNKLTDNGFASLIKHLRCIKTLNLGQNLLTDKSLDLLIKEYGKVPNLKNIGITRNKISQKEHKDKLDRVRSLGILVTV